MSLREHTPQRSGMPSRAMDRGLDGEAMRRRIAAHLFDEPLEPVRVGRFRVVGTLGEGGMGVVLSAEDDALDRRVAIKILGDPRLRADPEEHARLEREARTLAKLSHPNVVQVYEVGEHDGGIFIAMELVRGMNLRAWLAVRPRSLDEILEQFLAAAHGLDAAHRVGVIHRDFKPSNALVGEDGRVRIADFGLARALSPASTTTDRRGPGRADDASCGSETRITPVGTPAYMSPEQLAGDPLDERSDQYSFFVALHEAVHGRYPESSAASHAGRLSHSLRTAPTRPAPRWLRAVLARGLAPRPADRFASMTAVIDALQAGPRRRRSRLRSAALAAALVTAVAAGAALSGGSSRERCPDAHAQIAPSWDPARRQTIRAAFAATALSYAVPTVERVERSLDAYVDRWARERHDACEATWIRGEQSQALLDQSVRCLDGARASFTNLVRVLGTADAATVAGADTTVAALPSPERCRDPHALAMLLQPGERATDPDHRAAIDHARILYQTRQGSRAVTVLEQVLAELRAVGDAAAEAEALLLLGTTQARLLHAPASALHALHQAYDRAVAAGRTDLLWDTWNQQAWVHVRELGEVAEARRLLGHARSVLKSIGTTDPLPAAAIEGVEALILLAEDRPDDAVRLNHAIVETLRTSLGSDHPEFIHASNDLAGALAAAGDLARSTTMHQELMLGLTRLYGDEHPLTARSELNLGIDDLERGDLARARRHLAHARDVFVATYGPHAPIVGTSEFALAEVEAAEGAVDQAVVRAEAALAIFSDAFPRTHVDRVSVLARLVEFYDAQHQRQRVVDVCQELLAIHEAGYAGAFDLEGVLINLGEALCSLHRCAEALPHYLQVAGHFQRHPPAEPGLLAFPERGLGLAYLATRQPGFARAHLERAYALFKAAPHEREGMAENLAATARALADALAALRQEPARARALRRYADALVSGSAAVAP